MDKSTLETLDFLYEQSLDEDLGQQDRDYIVKAMERIAEKCEDFLTSPKIELTGEAKMRFAVLRKMANDTIDEVKKGEDVLIHWAKMRDYLVTLAPIIRAFLKKMVDKQAAA